jgi:hypothetical protein
MFSDLRDIRRFELYLIRGLVWVIYYSFDNCSVTNYIHATKYKIQSGESLGQ